MYTFRNTNYTEEQQPHASRQSRKDSDQKGAQLVTGQLKEPTPKELRLEQSAKNDINKSSDEIEEKEDEEFPRVVTMEEQDQEEQQQGTTHNWGRMLSFKLDSVIKKVSPINLSTKTDSTAAAPAAAPDLSTRGSDIRGAGRSPRGGHDASYRPIINAFEATTDAKGAEEEEADGQDLMRMSRAVRKKPSNASMRLEPIADA